MKILLSLFNLQSAQDDDSTNDDVVVNLSKLEEGFYKYGSVHDDDLDSLKSSEHKTRTESSVIDSDDETTRMEGGCPKTWTMFSPSIGINRRGSLDLESVFSTVRSVEDYEQVEETNESEAYRKSTSLQRAMPERLFALTITLLLEIPVLMMVSGGSDALCGLIGRSRYQLLIGFLPLTSAISGNVGLQASTLTTRAISHSHVTIADYWLWLGTEIAAAVYLGLGMGSLLGSIAFVASGLDWAFGITICLAQMLSIVTAGLTGTIAPLLFSFLFKRDSGKWGGPLETAIQDIVGSFAMVIVSYHILLLLGPGPIDANDVCGPTVPA